MTFDPTSVEVTCVTVPKDHCVQVPWEYVNVCGYSYQFCKNYHIHTYTYILRTYYVHTTYYVQNQWSHSLFLNYVQARQKEICLKVKNKKRKKKNTHTHSFIKPYQLLLYFHCIFILHAWFFSFSFFSSFSFSLCSSFSFSSLFFFPF